MDIYGMSSSGPDVFGVDDLFDFSNDNLFNNDITSSTDSTTQFQYTSNNNNNNNFTGCHEYSTDFTDHFSIPSDDIAELEWLSKFVDDSASNFPANNIAGTINFRPENTSCHSKSRSKRTRAPPNNNSWTSTPQKEVYTSSTSSSETKSDSGGVRRCTHCASEKTPQWRTGPLGPKTLCNACGVRYKSGRLVPEYRPVASPTFVLTQHSNSHRKVMELRRQKEMMSGNYQQQVVSSEHQIYAGRHNHRQQQLRHGSNYEIC
ncbi:GATA transcription factor 4-like [Bidens hawaiensis]|uniref:GATA transcription factor 4-like n=1 Tax=Bidens hawaiensis TaxID=980011 RepID=UPI00404B0D4B